MYYVYVLECSDRTFYTGITWNLKKRIREHNSRNGARYTKSRLPIKLVYYEIFENKHQAALREKVIKDMSQKKKRLLTEKVTTINFEKFMSSAARQDVYFERSENVHFERSEKRV